MTQGDGDSRALCDDGTQQKEDDTRVDGIPERAHGDLPRRDNEMIRPYYEDESVRLYHGDCVDILPFIEFDATVSDPPYGVLSESGSAATRRSGGNRDSGVMGWDVAPSTGLLDLITAKPAMLWGGCHLQLPATYGYLVWDKQIDGLNFGEVEFCWTNMRFAPRVFRYRAVGVDGGKVHPTQKPEALMQWCLSFLPKRGIDTIVDPFAGSGTTLVAAKRLGRRAIGIEINERYAEVAAKRLSQGALDLGFASDAVDPVGRVSAGRARADLFSGDVNG